MISEDDLIAAIFSVEQNIRDFEISKEHDKHDIALLKKWSDKIAEDKVKLQVLYCARGITRMMSGDEIEKNVLEVKKRLSNLHSPREMDLFDKRKPQDKKAYLHQEMVNKMMLYALEFVEGKQKRIL